MISHNSITYHLYKNALNDPDKTAVINQGRSISYKDLYARTESCANRLIRNGIQAGDIIGVQLSDSIDFIVLMFAGAAIGAAIAPIDKTAPEKTAADRFSALGTKCDVDDSFFKNLTASGPNDISYPELSGEETMIISLTSGSTSEPKAIELTQNIKYIRAKAHIDLYRLNKEDVILASTPLYHSLAERLVIMAVILGATAIILDDFKAHEWFNAIHNERVTFTISDSSQLMQISQMLLSPFVPEIDSLNTVVSSSSFLENHVKKELIDKFHCELYEIYGTSETSTLTNIDLKQSNNIRSVGKPLKDIELKILDPDEKGIGEIACKTPLMFKGYYNSDKLTEQSYENGFFKTGDLGKIDENGYLFYNGRKGELIKSNGVNIYPMDIEDAVRKMEQIRECAVFSYPDDVEGDVIGLAVTLEDKGNSSADQIREYCRTMLPQLAVPKYIFILPELPKNAMGKIMKNKIYENIIRLQMSGEY